MKESRTIIFTYLLFKLLGFDLNILILKIKNALLKLKKGINAFLCRLLGAAFFTSLIVSGMSYFFDNEIRGKMMASSGASSSVVERSAEGGSSSSEAS